MWCSSRRVRLQGRGWPGLNILHHSLSTVRTKIQDRIAHIDSQRPFSPALIDSFHRKHDYLRISLTERCNLRCFYCMPSEGVELSPKTHILTDDEVIHLASLFVKSGIRKIRLTGGEPTVRKGLDNIIVRLNELRQYGLESIAMTSNGLALHRRLASLVSKGLTHLNLSLDTLDPFKFEVMTRRPGHDAVLHTLDEALSCSNLRSIKLNVVVIKGLNDSEVLDFVELTKNKRLSVRFIEFMPFTGNRWDKAKVVPSAELLDLIKQRYPTISRAPDELNDTARSWQIPTYAGNIGFISSMSDHFCSSCNRLRLTADGEIKVCLFDAKEISLRDALRSGATDEDLLQIIGSAVSGKKEKHAGMEDIDVVTNRPMILIGGARQSLMHPFSRPPTLANLFPVAASSHSVCRVERRWQSTSTNQAPRLTHINSSGRPSMVDVGNKLPTRRTSIATGYIYIPKIAYELITEAPSHLETSSSVDQLRTKAAHKGDALTVAQLAAIMGCKRTAELIPLCHPLQLSNISVMLTPEVQEQRDRGPGTLPHRIRCTATVSCEGKTGVEMEALTAVSVGLLTVWDMLKAVAGKEMMIGGIVVSHKSGGKSGDFIRREAVCI